jgi:hypothetical protein
MQPSDVFMLPSDMVMRLSDPSVSTVQLEVFE